MKKNTLLLLMTITAIAAIITYHLAKAPKVSIVMPVYNGEKYLEKTIGFLLVSEFKDFEFIVIDDGSTDNSYQKLLRMAKEDRRLKVYKNKENLGITKTRNRGFELARGKYIAPMDQDDWSLPERLKLSVEYLDLHPNVDIVDVGTIEMKEYFKGIKNERLGALTYLYGSYNAERNALNTDEIDENIKLSLFVSLAVPTQSGAMMRKSFFDKNKDVRYRPNLKYSDDYGLYVDMVKKGARFHHIEDIAHIYNNLRPHSQAFFLTQLNEVNTVKAEYYNWAGLSFAKYHKFANAYEPDIKKFVCTLLEDLSKVPEKNQRFSQNLILKNHRNLCQ